MTVQELYDKAKDAGCLDLPVFKHHNSSVHEVSRMYVLKSDDKLVVPYSPVLVID